jgi:ATP-dependent Clp protease ATP-binding subunit ClpA
MNLFINGKLNPHAFEVSLRQATHEFSDVLLAAAQTQSALVESTHFLMALAKVPGGATQRSLSQLGLSSEQWTSGLADCAQVTTDRLPPAQLTEDSLHASAGALLKGLEHQCALYNLVLVSEPMLLFCALQQATASVVDLFRSVDVDLVQLARRVEDDHLKPPDVVPVFKADGVLILDSFQPGAKKVLTRMQSETESLGFKAADPRHLLLSLLEHEGGTTQYGIFHQGLIPRKIEEGVMLNLRFKGKRTRGTVPLISENLQPILQHILKLAGEFAGRDHLPRIAEPHLLRAFLGTDSAARRMLAEEKVNLNSLRAIAESADLSQDEEEDEATIADIQTVRARLQRRLVGQDDAIDRILPYVQRMRFGFTTPGRPVGVFLFCGQSGSGKTEMAKELARAVYGSEENLIFLEMGQFNAPESMNIFVGAPPGYVGYGEGKLTNGLRDKPRAVVLFDEVEKAHSKVLDALLRFLDEGRIDDPAGPVRDGSQCIVVLTSNVGAEALSQLWKQLENNPNWRALVREKLRQEFERNQFRPEFLNRVDELILFRTLTTNDYTEIARRLLARDLERLRTERAIDVIPDADLAQAIGEYCATINEGARAAQRLTQSAVITPVIDFILRQNCTPPVRLKVKSLNSLNDPDCEPTGVVERFE